MGHPLCWLGGLNSAWGGPWSYIIPLCCPSGLCPLKQKCPEMCSAVSTESGYDPRAARFISPAFLPLCLTLTSPRVCFNAERNWVNWPNSCRVCSGKKSLCLQRNADMNIDFGRHVRTNTLHQCCFTVVNHFFLNVSICKSEMSWLMMNSFYSTVTWDCKMLGASLQVIALSSHIWAKVGC